MRLVRNIPDQLVIAYRPWGWALFTGGLGAILIFTTISELGQGNIQGIVYLLPVALMVGFAYIGVRPVRVIFDAPSKSVEIIETTLISRARVTFGLDEISKAVTITQKTPKNLTQTQLQLVIPEGESAGRRAITGFSETQDYAYIAKLINAWLDSVRARA